MKRANDFFHRLVLPALLFEVALTLVVIAGGAVVRATGSGAGCGEHWPLCNGQAIPLNARIETVIEFTHRLSSGTSLLLFVAIFFMLRKALPRLHAARSWANLALISFLAEAAIGALLVLKKLVAGDTSYFRAIVIALHQVNTYILIAALLGMMWNWLPKREVKPKGLGPVWLALLVGWCLVAAMGAVTALGDTLFPATTLLNGWHQDLAAATHPLVRLRILHPVIASLVAMITLAVTAPGTATQEHSPRASFWVRTFILLQIACGLANWALLAPIWLQITHLLVADFTWLSIVWLAFSASASASQPSLTRGAIAGTAAAHSLT